MAGWHTRGVFIAEPSLAGFGRQLLNTVMEQVLKKAPLSLQRNIRQLKKGSQLCLGGGTAAGCRMGMSQRVFKEAGMGCEWRTT